MTIGQVARAGANEVLGHDEFVLRMLYRQNRAGGHLNDLLSDAADERVLQSAMSVRG